MELKRDKEVGHQHIYNIPEFNILSNENMSYVVQVLSSSIQLSIKFSHGTKIEFFTQFCNLFTSFYMLL